MSLILGFLPFALFTLVERLDATVPALLVAAATAAILIARARAAGKAPKLLELGALALFGGLGAIALATGASWSVLEVRTIVDVGLFALIAGSVAVGRPFTLAYARESVPAALWTKPAFVQRTTQIALAWTAAFAAMVLADVGMLAGLPLVAGVVVTIAAIALAGLYTSSRTRA